MRRSSNIWFATSNAHKFKEARLILKGTRLSLLRLSSKGVELQSDDPAEIAAHAAADAHRATGKPLFAEDTALFIRSLGGFPGTYASHAYRTLGLKRLLRIVPEKRRRAVFVSAVAVCREGKRPQVFIGRLDGRISDSPAGDKGFGFDPIFIPEGSSRTLAELSPREKCAISHRGIAIRRMAAWLNSQK